MLYVLDEIYNFNVFSSWFSLSPNWQPALAVAIANIVANVVKRIDGQN